MRGRLAEAGAALGIAADRWVAAVGDLRGPDGAAAVVAAATGRFGRVDVLLHLVGGWTGGSQLVDVEPAAMRGMLDQHLWTTFHITRAVVPGMVERGWGRIAAISSPFAGTPGAGMSAYGVAKAAEEVLLGALAREVAASGVTVNVLVVRTIDAEHKREREPGPRNAGSTTPEEIADVLLFLASDGAAAVNGARIPLFGRR